MKTFIYSFLLFIFISLGCFSQNMQKGFTFLETGKYKNAEIFFKNILKENPENNTAKLCYGRAVGLNGNATEATIIFTELLKLDPTNFEFKLNYGESLLWNKKFFMAKDYYKNLVQEDAYSFSALLGYANTLSNLKEYTLALNYIEKALKVSVNNPNALISKKYIHLGLANQQVQSQKYQEAIHTLKKNFIIYPKDKDTYLNLANTYVIAKQYHNAIITYNEMSKDKELYFIAKNGLALVAHLQGNDKESLRISKQNVAKLTQQINPQDTQKTKERYAQALIWNKKYKIAKNYIDTISKNKQNENWILGLKATLYTHMGDFTESIKMYDQILKNNTKSFDGNLGKANALKASKQLKKAYRTAKNTLIFYPKQKDITTFLTNIENSFIPNTSTTVSYSFDNGESKAYNASTMVNLPVQSKTILKAIYAYKNAFNNATDNNSISNLFGLGASYQIHSKINISTILGINKIKGNKNKYEQFTADILLKTQPYKLQNLDIGYKKELQNFNAELLNRAIVQNHFYTNYNLNTNFNLGWFTQYFYTSQSDKNERNLLFTSLYYNILNKPLLKTGVNYQYMSFKNNVPNIYFSPSTFNAVEVFMNLIKDKSNVKSKEFYYSFTAAIGYQFTEKEAKKTTYRIKTNLGYKFNKFCYLESYATQSNIAAAAVEVFTYTEIGLNFKWLFLKKPLFKIL